jgi:hypothetical protein
MQPDASIDRASPEENAALSTPNGWVTTTTYKNSHQPAGDQFFNNTLRESKKLLGE